MTRGPSALSCSSKRPPAQRWHTQGVEEVRGCCVVTRIEELMRRRFALDGKPTRIIVPTGPRQVGARTGGAHAGNGSQFFEQSLVKESQAFFIFVGSVGQRDACRQRPLGPKSRIGLVALQNSAALSRRPSVVRKPASLRRSRVHCVNAASRGCWWRSGCSHATIRANPRAIPA